MELVAVPCLRDNYAWLGHAPGERRAFVVDPGEAEPVARELAQRGLTLEAIVHTHHHRDHVGGDEGLLARFPGARVIAFVGDAHRILGATELVREGDVVSVAGTALGVWHVPGHTTGHVAYVAHASDPATAADVTGSAEPVAFVGDTLFGAGCGRMFEGTPTQYLASLRRLAALPGATRICCAHEYTEHNLRFAALVEPANEAVATRAARVRALRAAGRPSLPSSLSDELQTNPFLRVGEAAVRAHAERRAGRPLSDTEAFAELREERNGF